MLEPIKTGAEETSQDCRKSKKTVSSDSEYSGLAHTSLSLRDELHGSRNEDKTRE